MCYFVYRSDKRWDRFTKDIDDVQEKQGIVKRKFDYMLIYMFSLFHKDWHFMIFIHIKIILKTPFYFHNKY